MHRILLLDYDGTLVPLAPTPAQAAPDPELVELLRTLGALPDTELHIVSGRPREVLDAWLGGLKATLHGEHGLWVRSSLSAQWRMRFSPSLAWLSHAAAIMETAANAAAGSLLERKTASLAWHYRLVEPIAARRALDRLRRELAPLAQQHGLELLDGARVLELRDVRANKGAVAADIASAAPSASQIVAMGDDSTDEDMFAALPDDALTIHVGDGPTRARERLSDPSEARAWLRAFAKRG